ncbi:MAG: T9SS type A sorting domain-containing protein, partial [Candidatus Marinimicrobia bacterium]|nr:T9SS type A sorting domain-containing protein [Candidatus Neomarinimicrobiota bacterium]
EPTGTVTHNETNGTDAGYSIEVVVHTADFGYSVGDTVMLSVCMWDLDYSSADAYTEHVSDYAPNWWGTQWVATDFERYYLYRGVVLSNETVDIDKDNGKFANAFTLCQNYPNPFNPSTTINFEIPGSELVTLEIYNVLGQKVATLINDNLESGYHSVEWNGLTDHNESLPTGVYFCKLTFGESSKTSKMVLLK